MSEIDKKCGLGTIMNHAGEHGHPLHAHTSPIYQTSSFGFDSIDEAAKTFVGIDKEHYVYSRGRNPNAIALAKKIALLEGIDLVRGSEKDAEQLISGHCSASGMGAITATVFSHLEAGDHIVTHTSLYSGTHKLFTEVCARLGVTVSVLDSGDPDVWDKEVQAHPNTKMLYVETPSNPCIELYDIAALAEIAHKHDAWLVCDNTAATPYHQRPLTLGADVVVHSTTKFLNGHSAAIGGAVVSRHVEFTDFWGKLGQTAMELGATPSPSDCWQTSLGLKTFALRMERHAANAMAVADFLSKHDRIRSVRFPGLPDDPYHALASRQMQNGFGSFLSFELDGDNKAATRLIEGLRLATIAISFGSTDTVVQLPAIMTHSGVSRKDREAAGISDSLIRYCVGIEDTADLLDDLDQALKRL